MPMSVGGSPRVLRSGCIPAVEKEEVRRDAEAPESFPNEGSRSRCLFPDPESVFCAVCPCVYHEGGECFLPSVAAALAVAFLRTKSQVTINRHITPPPGKKKREENNPFCLRWVFPKVLGMKNVPAHPSEVCKDVFCDSLHAKEDFNPGQGFGDYHGD